MGSGYKIQPKFSIDEKVVFIGFDDSIPIYYESTINIIQATLTKGEPQSYSYGLEDIVAMIPEDRLEKWKDE